MRFSCTSLIVIFLLYTAAYAYRLNDNYVEVHEIDRNVLASIGQIPPQDPAVHSFPTVPTVPLIPICVKAGYFRDPFNCRKFYHCDYEDAIPAAFYCQSGLVFNAFLNACDNPEYVEC